MQTEIPEIMASVNDIRLEHMIDGVRRLPPLTQCCQFAALLRQAWALIPEEDEALFFDNVQRIERWANKL